MFLEKWLKKSMKARYPYTTKDPEKLQAEALTRHYENSARILLKTKSDLIRRQR